MDFLNYRLPHDYHPETYTYFSRIKERLNLENFTGRNTESVLQDLYSTILISNLETVLTEDIDEEFFKEHDQRKFQKKVNKAVSYNVIKNKIFDLLYNKKIDIDEMLTKMMLLFRQSPVQIRENRTVDRNKSGAYRKLRYAKTVKKICF